MSAVLLNRGKIVVLDTVLALTTRLLDYAGSTLNWLLLAFAVLVTGF